MTPEEVLKKAIRYQDYWGKEGGITVSGGDPLLHIDFLLALFRLAKKKGINTCLDTSAQPFNSKEPFYEKFLALMEVTDTVLLDIKAMDSDLHKKLTGHPNQNILDCGRLLSTLGVDVWIRHVLVPGLTDSEEELLALKQYISTLHNVKKVEVLSLIHIFTVLMPAPDHRTLYRLIFILKIIVNALNFLASQKHFSCVLRKIIPISLIQKPILYRLTLFLIEPFSVYGFPFTGISCLCSKSFSLHQNCGQNKSKG